MYAGRIVEDLPAADLATEAKHPYTRALLAAVPDMDTDLTCRSPPIPGRAVDPAQLPGGMRVRGTMPARRRRTAAPSTRTSSTDGAGGRVACWHAGEPIVARHAAGARRHRDIETEEVLV